VDAAEPFRIGRGKSDITGPPVGVKMLGYVRADQISEGIHLRQYARAFVIVDPATDHRLAIVTTDLMSVTHSVVLSVIDKLNESYPGVYKLDNVIIAATHSHAVPGGYWHYGSDTPIGTPFHPEHFDALTSAIANSILAAHKDLKPGHIRVAVGPVEGAGAQRSRPAYMRNPEEERKRYPTNTDVDMTLIRFDTAAGPIGLLNWFPVHPTSMSFNNKLISGDNKGYAAYDCERNLEAAGLGKTPFVAAFAQANCGDVTPNLSLDQRGPGEDEFESTRIIGERQSQAARRLFESATEELTGPVDSRQSYVDFAQVKVRDEFTHAGEQYTGPAAYGYSFGAGSTEDGGGLPIFREGMIRRERMIDAIARNIVPLPPVTDELRRLHSPKPILLPVGLSQPPSLPNVLPISVARIGQLAIVAGPAEYTTMSGRRFREGVIKALPGVKYVAIAGYANDYAGYVATREEYGAQNYEGAATLFGPWTQAAYQQEFVRLAEDIAAARPSESHEKPDEMRGKVRPTPLGGKPDPALETGKYGDLVDDAAPQVERGEHAVASFRSGNPQNGYRPERQYATIERKTDDAWRAVASDGNWEVKVSWKSGVCKIEWTPPKETSPGEYRIVHHGVYKTDDGRLHTFDATSRTFEVR
jgi:neutral ceramidase